MRNASKPSVGVDTSAFYPRRLGAVLTAAQYDFGRSFSEMPGLGNVVHNISHSNKNISNNNNSIIVIVTMMEFGGFLRSPDLVVKSWLNGFAQVLASARMRTRAARLGLEFRGCLLFVAFDGGDSYG